MNLKDLIGLLVADAEEEVRKAGMEPLSVYDGDFVAPRNNAIVLWCKNGRVIKAECC